MTQVRVIKCSLFLAFCCHREQFNLPDAKIVGSNETAILERVVSGNYMKTYWHCYAGYHCKN